MTVVVVVEQDGSQEAAVSLAERLGLEIVASGESPYDALLLAFTDAGLVLRESGAVTSRPLIVEFSPGRGSALLRRATLAGKENVRRLIDATGGLGQDAFAVAEAGVEVELIERSGVVAALLSDGLERALADPSTSEAAGRMSLRVADARELLPKLPLADVVYLDPMYPVSGREGGKVKEMRMLRVLLGDDLDADGLLSVARKAASRRVAVKRPVKAPPLAGEKPSGSLKGTTVRYDLYAPLR